MLLLGWDTGKVRDWLSGLGRFKCGLRCKGCVNCVIMNVIQKSITYKYFKNISTM